MSDANNPGIPPPSGILDPGIRRDDSGYGLSSVAFGSAPNGTHLSEIWAKFGDSILITSNLPEIGILSPEFRNEMDD